MSRRFQQIMITDGRHRRTTKASRRPSEAGVSFSVVEEAKARVRVVDLADRLVGPGGLKKVGAQWAAKCPLPGHDDRSPSFAINDEKNLWYCFACSVGGDVLELARLAWGYEKADIRTVAGELLLLYGHPLPERPPSWFAKQDRQKGVRQLAHDARAEVLARRLWRAVFGPIVSELEDPKERLAAARKLWPKILAHSRLILERTDEEKRLKGRK
jgi:hypothetical protein